MTNTILLAVDTTSHTEAATDLARDLATGTGDRVVVLHVHEFAVGRFGRIQVDCADGEGEKIVSDVVDRLKAGGVTAEADVRKTPVGHIAKAIDIAAGETDARMIIVGSATSHDLPRIPFGSVVLRLLHISDRPVLIVPRAHAAAAADSADSVDATV
ncbi:MAG TPA: universal stress protein [Streptosporangiaceae bacterium]|nr:universal stress protein [Streptosporangiaceae bacterium]